MEVQSFHGTCQKQVYQEDKSKIETGISRERGVGYHPIYHPEIERNLEDFQGLCARFGKGSSLDIGAISAQRVIGEIDKVLN